jgi:hypothetical protein
VTDEELLSQILLQVLLKAEKFAASTGESSLQNLEGSDYELFAAGALSATSVLLQAFEDLTVLNNLNFGNDDPS